MAPVESSELSHDQAGHPHELGNCALSEIESFLPSVFYPRTAPIFLQMSSPGRLDFVLERQPTGLQAWAQVQTRAEETALLQFLQKRGLLTASEAPPAGQPLPLIRDISPLPTDPGVLLKFAVDLFREVCGLIESSELKCSYIDYSAETLP